MGLFSPSDDPQIREAWTVFGSFLIGIAVLLTLYFVR
jgi:hypothetical protein